MKSQSKHRVARAVAERRFGAHTRRPSIYMMTQILVGPGVLAARACALLCVRALSVFNNQPWHIWRLSIFVTPTLVTYQGPQQHSLQTEIWWIARFYAYLHCILAVGWIILGTNVLLICVSCLDILTPVFAFFIGSMLFFLNISCPEIR